MSSARLGRRALTIFLVVVAVEVVVVLGFAAWSLAAARGELAQARRFAEAGQDELGALELEPAQASFASAATHFDRGAAHLRNPAVRIVATVPFARENIGTVEALAVSGGIVADTGADVLATVNRQPDGLRSYLPADGRLPVKRLARLAERAGAAEQRLADAAATMDGVPATRLAAPVRSVRSEFDRRLTQTRDLVGAAADATGAFADMLGGNGTRRYLFGAQNPAELRGTGGFIGAYAVATFERGRLRLSRFVPIQQLRSLPLSDVPPPSSDYAARYNRYGGAGFWPALNATPDFPSAAEAMLRLYERTEGAKLDGAIVVDPAALESLLRVVGEVQVPDLGPVRADDVVDVVANVAYDEFSSSQERKEVLGAVAAGALQRLLEAPRGIGPEELLEELVPVGRDRHVLLYSTRPPVQRALRDLGLAGALIEPVHDTVSVIVNNAAVNKVDFYVDRAVDYQVALHEDGSATGTLHVTFDNGAPASGPGRHVLGPHVDGLRAGDDRSLVSVFCGRCEPTDAKPALGDRVGRHMVLEEELGHTVASTLLTVPRGTSKQVRMSWRLEDAWSPSDGCYALRFLSQPTIRGTTLRVAVQPPDGYRTTSESGASDVMFEEEAEGVVEIGACYTASDVA